MAQPVVYVRAGATGANNGTSWQDAYAEVRQALPAAVPPSQIWVAAGSYKPAPGTDRTATFYLRNGIALYGGFSGTETQIEERDPVMNVTILSGEIGSPTSVADNSCHVVTGSGTDSTAMLDGFTVAGGYARFCAIEFGGGLLAELGSPVVRNARFFGNDAVAGGAVYIAGGSVGLFEDCEFEGNQANQGGGMATVGSSPRLARVVFRANVAGRGGAMSTTSGSRPVCVDCDLQGNSAVIENGGAVYNVSSAPLFLITRFLDNASRSGGGGVWSEETGSNMACVGCTLARNTTETGSGGAVYSTRGSPTFANATFEGNTSGGGGRGGAIHIGIGTVVQLANVVLSGNQSGGDGGALHATSGWFEAVNVTAAGNRAGPAGQQAGAFLHSPGGSTLDNVVLWDNEGTSVIGGGAVTLRRGIVEGGCAPPMICESVSDVDPLFVRPPFTDGPDDYGDLRLQVGSPAIDAGLAAYLPADIWDLDEDGDTTEVLPIDILGQPRVQGLEVDLGAYEGGVVVAGEPGAPPAGHALRVRPNPTAGGAIVTLELPNNGASTRTAIDLAVFDVTGRRVATLHDGALPAGRHQFAIPSGLRPGAYRVRASAAAGASTTALHHSLVIAR